MRATAIVQGKDVRFKLSPSASCTRPRLRSRTWRVTVGSTPRAHGVNLTLFDFLVTNVRLGEYNGLHLVYLRSPDRRAPRAIVYSDERDPGLAREAQRAGAFYEVGTCLPVTLAAYVTGTLPVRDRRDPAILDRRGLFCGGRRSWDHHLVSRPR